MQLNDLPGLRAIRAALVDNAYLRPPQPPAASQLLVLRATPGDARADTDELFCKQWGAPHPTHPTVERLWGTLSSEAPRRIVAIRKYAAYEVYAKTGAVGTVLFASGDSYRGPLSSECRAHGAGVYHVCNGDALHGTFVHGEPRGTARYVWANGDYAAVDYNAGDPRLVAISVLGIGLALRADSCAYFDSAGRVLGTRNALTWLKKARCDPEWHSAVPSDEQRQAMRRAHQKRMVAWFPHA